MHGNTRQHHLKKFLKILLVPAVACLIGASISPMASIFYHSSNITSVKAKSSGSSSSSNKSSSESASKSKSISESKSRSTESSKNSNSARLKSNESGAGGSSESSSQTSTDALDEVIKDIISKSGDRPTSNGKNNLPSTGSKSGKKVMNDTGSNDQVIERDTALQGWIKQHPYRWQWHWRIPQRFNHPSPLLIPGDREVISRTNSNKAIKQLGKEITYYQNKNKKDGSKSQGKSSSSSGSDNPTTDSGTESKTPTRESGKGGDFGVGQLSPPGVQWSRIGGVGNTLFGVQTKTTYDVSYHDLTSSANSINEGAAAEYGMVLNQMGLDHSSRFGINKSVIQLIGRLIGGMILLILYALSVIESYVFRVIAWIFSHLNPISWLTGNSFLSTSPITSGTVGVIRHLIGEVRNIGAIWTSLIFAGSLFLAYTGIKNGGREGSGRTTGSRMIHSVVSMFVRMFQIWVLPVFLAAIVMFFMKSVTGAFDTNNGSATNFAIYSTLVQDRDWFQHTRLALPSYLQQGKAGQELPFGEDQSLPPADHAMVLNINAKGAGYQDAEDTLEGASHSGNGDVSAGSNPAGYGYQDVTKDGDSSDSPKNERFNGLDGPTLSMIWEWLSDDGYTNADWSAFVRAHLPKNVIDSNGSDNMSTKTEVGYLEDTYKELGKKLDSYAADVQYPFIDNGTLKLTGSPGNKYYESSSAEEIAQEGGVSGSAASLPDDAWGGISTIGMYNYLDSLFYPQKMAWTYTTNLWNELTAPQHKVVGVAGHGLEAFGNYVLMVGLIGSISILGFLFLLYLIRITGQSSALIVGYLFGNELGMRMMGWKLTLAVANIVLAFVGSSVLYNVGTDILTSFATIPDQIFNGKTPSGAQTFSSFMYMPGIAQAGISPTIYGIICGFVGIMLLLLAFWLYRARRPVIGAFSHWMKNILQRVLTGKGGGASSNSNSNSTSHMGGNHSLIKSNSPHGSNPLTPGSNSNRNPLGPNDSSSGSGSSGAPSSSSNSSGTSAGGPNINDGNRANDVIRAGNQNYGGKSNKNNGLKKSPAPVHSIGNGLYADRNGNVYTRGQAVQGHHPLERAGVQTNPITPSSVASHVPLHHTGNGNFADENGNIYTPQEAKGHPIEEMTPQGMTDQRHDASTSPVTGNPLSTNDTVSPSEAQDYISDAMNDPSFNPSAQQTGGNTSNTRTTSGPRSLRNSNLSPNQSRTLGPHSNVRNNAKHSIRAANDMVNGHKVSAAKQLGAKSYNQGRGIRNTISNARHSNNINHGGIKIPSTIGQAKRNIRSAQANKHAAKAVGKHARQIGVPNNSSRGLHVQDRRVNAIRHSRDARRGATRMFLNQPTSPLNVSNVSGGKMPTNMQTIQALNGVHGAQQGLINSTLRGENIPQAQTHYQNAIANAKSLGLSSSTYKTPKAVNHTLSSINNKASDVLSGRSSITRHMANMKHMISGVGKDFKH